MIPYFNIFLSSSFTLTFPTFGMPKSVYVHWNFSCGNYLAINNICSNMQEILKVTCESI